ncbi:MAG: DUF4136 domain-containing protein [Flavobacteriaceae bacterium]|nr:DUF4136 domain-containing protein [Bacteroidia bacterium]MBT8288640.1 DUF4136 domain-containing protein [Bacteroidia bacterium]NNF74486.1 DUF4136 domain-containing protein [Flavobacteriaceae bacterium]NNK72523.1 DUF4136 domain-containing protein [Flavobacteriaceae bacterium]
MKKLQQTLALVMIGLMLSSCVSVKVASDFDRDVDFSAYKSFAFYKPGIDKAEISDLDKKRILRAIDAELLAKGMTKSEEPDVLVSIFTKSRERINVYNNAWGWGPGYYGWGWNPWWGGYGGVSTSTSTEGTLYIDLIDADRKELVWQGIGRGYLNLNNMEKKEERIKEFVNQILERYPPGVQQ